MKKILLIILLCLPVLCFGQAHLKGRTVVGTLPRPSYTVDAEGVVVVQVKVDQYGNVTEAIPGTEGTTVTNKLLWSAARNAAMKAHFNMSADAPALQTGTITYRFGINSKTGSLDTVDSEEEPYTSVKDIVENEKYGTFLTKAFFSETYNQNDLVFLIEDEDYIIPIKLVKNDLGAVKRFRSLDLHKGDTLTIRGKLSTIYIRADEYKGLEEASIIDVRRMDGREVSMADGGEANPESEPFQLVEQKPTFNSGDANEFSKWVNSHLIYPEKAKENGIQGRVTLQYTIDVDGSVKNVKVLRGVEPSLDKEAVRVVSSSPKWKPGKSKNQPVPVTYTFPVIFQLR